MKLSATLIVRNEEKNLIRLLPQLVFADEVIVVDTGSDDNTCRIALEQGARVFHFEWNDDFSAARNYAVKQAVGDFIIWLDADDVLPQQTQNKLLGWKKSAHFDDFYYMRYRMDGDFPFWFWRERVVRNCPQCRFKGFIHEAISPFGSVAYLDCEIIHKPSATHEKRNLNIYRNAIRQGKRFRLRDKYYFARTLIDNGLWEEALPILRAFASDGKASVIDRADAYRLLAIGALDRGDHSDALKYLSRSTGLLPPNGEICCLFGSIYFRRGDYRLASEWYRMAISSRSQGGFVNEYYTGFLPGVQLSVCLWRLGKTEEAKAFHNYAKSIAPNNPVVVANDIYFR